MLRSVVTRVRPKFGSAMLALALVACGGTDRGGAPGVRGLETAYKAYAVRLPDRADDARPLTAKEWTAIERPECAVCGITIERPIGTSATDRPVLAWRALPGANRYHVRLETIDAGAAVRASVLMDESTSATSVPFPAHAEALAVGRRYLLGVWTESGATASGRSVFDVLPVPYRSRWKTIVGDLESNERDAVRDLLLAHAAVRRGLFDEAERRLAAFEAARPGDAEAATMRHELTIRVERPR